MKFNQSKFEVIRYGKNEEFMENIYEAGNETIQEKEKVKYLGVWMSNDCTLREHIYTTAKNARQMAG